VRLRLRAAVTAVALTAGLLFATAADAATPFTWTPANIDGVNQIGGISCPTPTMCVATDTIGNVIPSDDPAGGVTAWALPENIAGTAINDISCPTTTLCVAVDQGGFAWTSTAPTLAGTWTGTSINAAAALRAVSCPSTTLCVAAGANGNVVWTTNPTAGPWTIAHIDGTQLLSSISCPTSALCVTGDDVGNELNTTTPTGLAAAWSAPIPISPGVLQGMSCPTTAFCVGVDDSGNAITTSTPTGLAAAWTLANVDGVAFLNWVSCPTVSLCVAADSAGKVLSSSNPAGGAAAWGSAVVNGGQVQSVSCPSTAFCAAVGNGGNVIIGVQATLSAATAGTGTGTVSGNGINCPGTCSQVYPIGTVVTLTAVPGADGSTFTGWSGACTGTGTCNLTMSTDRAVTATFDVPQQPTAGPSSNPAPGPTPGPAAPSALPPPTAGQTANASPVSGLVLARVAGTKKFVPLASPEQVRFGTVFDTRKGVVSDGHGGFYKAQFSEGVFKLVAAAGGFAELQLVGGNFKGCPKAARGGAAAAGKTRGRSVRHLWGEGAGKFRTKGRFSSATIRGTKWLTDDRCKGTLTRVAIGSVTVRDLVKRKSIALKAPRSYFAAAAVRRAP
jgi:hypothetical protein